MGKGAVQKPDTLKSSGSRTHSGRVSTSLYDTDAFLPCTSETFPQKLVLLTGLIMCTYISFTEVTSTRKLLTQDKRLL